MRTNIWILLAAVSACAPKDDSGSTRSMTSSSDTTSVPACAGRLKSWLIDGAVPDSAVGVSACSRKDAEAVFGAGEAGTGRFAGIPREWTRFAVASGTVRVVWSGDRAVMIAAEGTPVSDAAGLLARLGESDDHWPSQTDKDGWATMDHVFAKRGLTLSIGQSIANPEGPRAVLAVYFYEPTDVEGYVRLGGKDEWVRRIPER